MPVITQLNLQRQFGGGEVYTRFLTAALAQLGWRTRLVVPADATCWQDMDLSNAILVPVLSAEDIANHIPVGEQVLTHGAMGGTAMAAVRAKCPLFGIAHMPSYGRSPLEFQEYRGVLAVSDYVRCSLHDIGVKHCFDQPLLGVADLDRLRGASAQPILATSRYDWDMRKGRDRLFAKMEPWIEPFIRRQRYQKQPGLTLGIVSRLTTIKQFPQLFTLLAPILGEFPNVRLEVFGAGGYASVRDLQRALKPVADRVRYWGHQRDVASVYRQLDFVMSGLPEKEALGLNLIEAQACNTPVLAVNAAPFTETVAHGKTGFLYQDPRQDGGADFRRLLSMLTTAASFPRPLECPEHLQQFSFDAFVKRVESALVFIQQRTI
ncbi:glycosyltransferase involved in cell wall biosynthesis [Chitinivorax tropicus]|uniref:Glycosyltransferase involved in cell wall biosynthesis n=1 Tax=Chitinivorax tropicus TaxID=714531 RepID=A0A840MP76_9PROT|nr:glycosyltransferase family 4 protein [Chitinivorax tropicus]MBB5017051.1 glycosyltransferase involved in cell wall biosynthesis [Chitinivorax tropicus]